MKRNVDTDKLCPVLQDRMKSQSNDVLPVIISYKNNKRMPEGKLSALSDLSNKLNYELPIVNGCACEMCVAAIHEIKMDPDVEYISYDSRVFAVMDIARKTIGADNVLNTNYTGRGVTVAIIDTGVAPHRDLILPTNRIVGFKDFVNGELNAYDDNGHGTHCAGILGSSGYSSNGKYKGIAPEVNILSVKVLDEKGNGKTSDILSAIQWIIKTKETYKTKIVNFSLGAIAQYRERRDPLVKAANLAIENNMIVIAAVGNSGPMRSTILSPATGRYVISVGALNDNRPNVQGKSFKIADFSSRGPTIDKIKKPDLLAPGVDIMSLSNDDLRNYTTLSGTSMAAPMVTGVAALLLNENPNYTQFDIKKILMNSCSKIKAASVDQGAGVLNLSKIFKN